MEKKHIISESPRVSMVASRCRTGRREWLAPQITMFEILRWSILPLCTCLPAKCNMSEHRKAEGNHAHADLLANVEQKHTVTRPRIFREALPMPYGPTLSYSVFIFTPWTIRYEFQYVLSSYWTWWHIGVINAYCCRFWMICWLTNTYCCSSAMTYWSVDAYCCAWAKIY